jgi:hypothetical protein
MRYTAFRNCRAEKLGNICGDVAQLGERRVRIAEVTGSNPVISTIFMPSKNGGMGPPF